MKITCRWALLLLLSPLTSMGAPALDIPVMTWTPRSDWVNVKSAPYHAVGDGVADDTAAIQAALTTAGAIHSSTPTVYFPPGTYKITATLDWQGSNVWPRGAISGAALIGCGRSTILKWSGASGAAMFWTKGATTTRYIGLAWDGNNIASCAYEASAPRCYEYSCRHENESFRNFTVPGSYVSGKTEPAAGIIAGLSIENNSPDAETMIWNCLFVNCTNGIIVGHEQANNYLWEIKGCEFDRCGTAILNEMGKFAALDCHFQGSTEYDISSHPGQEPRVRRCTSVGSHMFFYTAPGRSVGGKLIQDCRVDSWTNPEGAIQFGGIGPNEVLDCVFTNPSDGGIKNPHNSPIVVINSATYPSLVTVSNNSCPTVATENLVNMGGDPPSNLLTIPAGAIPAIIATRATAHLTFLHTTEQDDSTHIVDVTQAPYNADKTGKTDVTAKIQDAINAAAKAGSGSIVYLPAGRYKVSQTINVTGADYTIQGAGTGSVLYWAGNDNGTFFNVTSPQKLSMEQIQFIYDARKFTDVTAIHETSATACEMNYDGLYYNQSGVAHTPNGSGLKLDSLPAGARVTVPDIDLPLSIHDCGPAEILFNYSIGGRIIINGATHPKTGFLGIINTENGSLNAVEGVWNILVDDNQDLVIGDYYSEQSHNCIKIARGAGSGTGYVTITGIKQNYNPAGVWDAIHIDNYAGRFFYGQVTFSNQVPTNIVQTGTNACDLILDSNSYYPLSRPLFRLDKGARLIQLNNVQSGPPATFLPNVQPEGWGAATARALDDERRLGQYDLEWNYGIGKAAAGAAP